MLSTYREKATSVVVTQKEFLLYSPPYITISVRLPYLFSFKKEMRLSLAAVVCVLLWANAAAFAPLSSVSVSRHVSLSVSAVSDLSVDAIGDMGFRELQNECKSRGLSSEGTTATLRSRIREAIGPPMDPFSHEAIQEQEQPSEVRLRNIVVTVTGENDSKILILTLSLLSGTRQFEHGWY
jgi:hypothetical protein